VPAGYQKGAGTTTWRCEMAFDDKLDNKTADMGGKDKEGVG
jgi:hypothetical protein